ncbi:MAG: T9SS type A sorting domain-containing protein, partial [Bacteroidales bacterium]|nr:T9SS type A sorting domain-containing protein [Bacteroidales bacterium]
YIKITGENNSFTVNITNSVLSFEISPFIIQSDELCKLVLILKKEDNLYLCEDIIIPLNDIAYKITNNNITFCKGDEAIEIGEESQLHYSYKWYIKEDPTTTLSTQSKYKLPHLEGGKYEYILDITRPGGCSTQSSVSVYVNTTAVWTPSESGSISEKEDWNNPFNWSTGLVPIPCTDVYIPGNSTSFPNLTEETDYVCNNIYFMHGAHIGYPHRLKYSRAHVQWNWELYDSAQDKSVTDINNVTDTKSHLSFSAAYAGGFLQRNQWHMLSAPLHNMYSGDLAFGGYPLTYMRKFNVIGGPVPPEGGVVEALWTGTYSSLKEPLKLGEGWIMWINTFMNQNKYRETAILLDNPVSDEARTIGLAETNGIVEFPYYQNKDMVRSHRISKTENHNQTYYYINNGLSLTGETETVIREENDRSYRFIVEEFENSEWKFPSTTSYTIAFDKNVEAFEPSFIVGNPYMSMLDFKAFHEANKGVLSPNYSLWNNNAFMSYTFNEYLGLLELAEGNTSNLPETKGYIEPMHAFLVKAIEDAETALLNEITITFSVDMAVVRPQQTLRSSNKDTALPNVLKIKASNKSNFSETLIGRYESADDSYVSGEDIYKVFSQDKNIPAIFTLSDNHAVEMNFISNNEIMIPIGIRTHSTGKTTLTFSGMPEFHAESIHFIDNQEEKLIDLSNRQNVDYTFSNDIQGENTGRFFIHISQPPKGDVGIESIETRLINAYRVSNGIFVFSSHNDPIQEIKIYDIDGKLYYSNSNIDSPLYTVKIDLSANRPFIVRIVTKKQVKSIKL